MKHPLVRVSWTDAHNNNGQWFTAESLDEFFVDESFKVVQVGFLVRENEDAILLASRIATNAEQFGMVERIPRRMVETLEVLSPADI